MCEFTRNVKNIANNAPINGHIHSTDASVRELKRIHGLDDTMLCILIEYMHQEGMIRDFGLRFSEWNQDKIDFYWFR